MTREIRKIVDGIGLRCLLDGEGPPLLLLHGWGGSAESFAPVARYYANRFTVYSLDFPGFGGSDAPPAPWSVDEYAALLNRFMEGEGLRGAAVIAHSFGGRVAILTAARHPERFGKILLTDSAGLIPRRSLRYYFRVYGYKLLKGIAARSGLRRLLGALGLDVERKLRERAGSADYRALNDAMRGTFVRVVNQNLRPYLPKIQSPVLLVWGEKDTDTPPAFGRIMEREIPDAGLVVFEGAGHFAYLEQFDRFVRVADAFWGGNS